MFLQREIPKGHLSVTNRKNGDKMAEKISEGI